MDVSLSQGQIIFAPFIFLLNFSSYFRLRSLKAMHAIVVFVDFVLIVYQGTSGKKKSTSTTTSKQQNKTNLNKKMALWLKATKRSKLVMEHRGVCFDQRIVTFAFRSCCESDTYSTLNLVLNGRHDSRHPCLTKDLVFPFEFAESPCLVYHPYGKTVFINLSSLLTVTSMCSGTVVRAYIPGISPTENSCS